MQFGQALLRLSFVLLLCCVGHTARADQEIKLPTPQGVRRAILVPAARPGPNPTIIVLHGARISAGLLAHSSFAEAAAVHGFTAIFPEGEQQIWNYAGSNGTSHADDVGFLNALVHRLIDAKIADPTRLYLAGISNGGMMAFTMICQKDSPFAGIATVVAAPPTALAGTCHPRKPLQVVMMNGTADPLVPFAGGRLGFFGQRGTVVGVKTTARFFANAEGCSGKTTVTLPKRDRDERTHVTRVAWTGCVPHSGVYLYEIKGGGHQIPGGPTFMTFLFGRPNHDIRAADVILSVFAGS